MAPGGAGRETRFFIGIKRRTDGTTEAATTIEQQVEALLARGLPEVDLRAARVVGRVGSGTLTVVIDHPGQVDHALCAEVTRVLGDAGLRDRYAVEVSSPGPEPPLRVTRHFVAAIGETVRLGVNAGSIPGSSRSVSGILTAASDDALTVATPDGDVVVLREAVRRARVVCTSNVPSEGRSLS